jgi:hypothetical protein
MAAKKKTGVTLTKVRKRYGRNLGNKIIKLISERPAHMWFNADGDIAVSERDIEIAYERIVERDPSQIKK